jgi:DNA polymerase
MFYTDVLALLSSCLRGALIPDEGMQFYVADYSAIEARVVLWLADAQVALEVFRRGGDIYCDMAEGIYGRPITKKDKAERQFGKVTILGLGYGMGFLTFLLTLRSYGIKFTEESVRTIMGDQYQKYHDWVRERLWPTPPPEEEATVKRIKSWKTANRQAASDRRRLEEAREVPGNIIHELALCKFTVDKYRSRYPEVKDLWGLQEKAACRAVIKAKEEYWKAYEEFRDPNVVEVQCGKVTWFVEDAYLYCRLPSGRCLVYNQPEVKYQPTPWGDKRSELRFMGVHKKTKKWARMATYGGSIVENIDQATARDMMAASLAKVSMLFDSGELQYMPITTIHDELLAEAPLGYGDVKQFEHLLTDLPPEYEGCPVAAEGGRLDRYQK